MGGSPPPALEGAPCTQRPSCPPPTATSDLSAWPQCLVGSRRVAHSVHTPCPSARRTFLAGSGTGSSVCWCKAWSPRSPALVGRQESSAEGPRSGRTQPPPSPLPLTLVTGAAQLAEGEMVPVLVVGIFGTLGTNGVLAAAAFHGDVCAWNGSRALQCQGSPDPPLPLQLRSLQDPVLWRATHKGWLAGFPGRWCLSSLRGSSGVGQSPLPLTSRPQLPRAIASHLGGSGSSRPDAWVRSTPFPSSRTFGSLCGMGAPSRGAGGGGENYSGVCWEGQRD